MFISEETQEAVQRHAIQFVSKPLEIEFTDEEERVLRSFFTNTKGRVCIMHSLPASISAVITAMYSRMKNPRGLRGTFIEFILTILALDLPETSEIHEDKIEAFLKQNKIPNLPAFLRYSDAAVGCYDRFLKGCGDPEYMEKLATSHKASKFMQRNRDKYGHNSIARMGSLHILLEGVSILAAKAVESTRVGSGYVELSTRFVDMLNAQIYVTSQEVELYGGDGKAVADYLAFLFSAYLRVVGNNLDGIFPTFLRKKYSELFSDVGRTDLEHGIGGETYDVAGCLLPASTLTSLCCYSSGEALPQLLKHLLLEEKPECTALVEAIIAELKKVGGNQFVRHYEATQFEVQNWSLLNIEAFTNLAHSQCPVESVAMLRLLDEPIKAQFQLKEGFSNDDITWKDVVAKVLKVKRGEHDKLPSEFEAAVISVKGVMSYRGHRDLQRQQLSTHNRTPLTPYLGFYSYDKSAPQELHEIFQEAERRGSELYESLKDIVPESVLEYILPLGFKVGYTYSANIRQHEFCNWQRSKPDVNHEVRQQFLQIDRIVDNQISDWELLSRTNRNAVYLFARYGAAGPIKLAD